MPRWVRLLGVVAIVVFALLVVAHIVARGGLGHDSHTTPMAAEDRP